MSETVNKSQMFREMYDQGMGVAQIAKETGCHYSYVYGVIQRLCNKRGEEIRREKKGPTRSDQIREMYAQGMKVGQIAKKLNANYSFVFSVCKKYKEQMEAAKKNQ